MLAISLPQPMFPLSGWIRPPTRPSKCQDFLPQFMLAKLTGVHPACLYHHRVHDCVTECENLWKSKMSINQSLPFIHIHCPLAETTLLMENIGLLFIWLYSKKKKMSSMQTEARDSEIHICFPLKDPTVFLSVYFGFNLIQPLIID